MREVFRCPHNPVVICKCSSMSTVCEECKISYAEPKEEGCKNGQKGLEKV